MNEIIERLQKAEGPSRELDGEIFALCGGSRWQRALNDATAFSHRGAAAAKDYAPYYTKSFDAALTLIPQGWGFYVRHDGEGAAAALTYPKACCVTPHHCEHATSPTIALCIAALRALNKGEIE